MRTPGLTALRPSPAAGSAGNGTAPASLPRQRRRGIIALGTALLLGGAVAGAGLYSSAGHREQVLAVARAVPAGAVITPGDLRTASVAASGSGLAVIPAAQEKLAAGQTAAAALQPGQLLVPADLTAAAVPAAGQQLVPVPLKTAEVPASGLKPGDQVLVIATPGSGGQASGSTGTGTGSLPGGVPATVYAVSAPDQAGDVTADLITTAASGPSVARQASTGQIAVLLTRRP